MTRDAFPDKGLQIEPAANRPLITLQLSCTSVVKGTRQGVGAEGESSQESWSEM